MLSGVVARICNRLRGVGALIAWAKALVSFCIHVMTVWDRPANGDRREIQEWEERAKQGPMALEYERIERMGHRAIILLRYGHEPSAAELERLKALSAEK